MIVARLMGGLGNQLFQYAMAKRVAVFHNTILKLDLSFLNNNNIEKGYTQREYALDVFAIEPDFLRINSIGKIKSKLLNKTIQHAAALGLKRIHEKHFNVDEDLILAPPDNAIYIGYWQSERYFADIANQLRSELVFRKELNVEQVRIKKAINSCEAVCVHVRRTDFLGSTHEITGKEYFKTALLRMREYVKDPHFFVFSDDIEWCKEQFSSLSDISIVSNMLKGFKDSGHLQLMSSCRHFILSNSSFSWWACWLSSNPTKKVIAPARWFADPAMDSKDLYGKDWILS